MPKINPPLTDKAIKGLKPSNKKYKKSDGKNLYIFVEPSGRKFFAFEYKSPITAKIRRIVLGEYPILSLATARERKIELLKQIEDGIDPKNQKDEIVLNFKDVALEWMEIKASNVNKTTYDKELLRLEKHVFPYLGNRDITSIGALDIIDVLKKIEKSGIYETTNRVFMLLSQIYKYAVSTQKAKHNIIADINYQYTFKAAKVRNFPTLTKPDEIKGLLLGIDSYQGDIKTKVALKFAIYTAARPFNVRTARWDEINLKDQIWQISSQKMKMREYFEIPLSRQAIKLLNEYQEFAPKSNFLFPSVKSSVRCMSENTLNGALRRLGYTKDEIVSHGFRAMFSTVANENAHIHGFSVDVIERCLAHKEKNKVRDAYNRASYLSQMRRLMQWWADYLDQLGVN